MGQEGYIIRTGIGFDIDRRSGQDALGFMESIADTMNNSQLKKSVAGIQERNSALSKENDKLDEKNKKAKLIPVTKFSEIRYPTMMEPNLVIEYYSR